MNQLPIPAGQLVLKHEKILPVPLKPHLISICPQLDLIAAATTETQVEIFRFNGHRAMLHKRTHGSALISSIRWSPNDRLLVKRGMSCAEWCAVFMFYGHELIHRLQAAT